MSIRNFYIEAYIDGRKESLKGGPKSKDGGFSLSVYQRKEGQLERIIEITGFVNGDGILTTHVATQSKGQTIKTQR